MWRIPFDVGAMLSEWRGVYGVANPRNFVWSRLRMIALSVFEALVMGSYEAL